MKLHYVTRKHVSHVELKKDSRSSVGIVVKGGAKYGLRPTIEAVKKGSVAYRSHCVSEGDEILSVCGRDSKQMNRKDVKRLLQAANNRIELKLQYEIREACISDFGIYRLQRMSLSLKKEFDSFGFTLRKNSEAHAVSTEFSIISNIRPGGPAYKEGCMKPGDRLLQIDDQSLSWLSLAEVANILNEKEEATFLVEYSIEIVDSCIQPGEKVELEFDCPDEDIGIVLSTFTKGLKTIKEIRKGSLAERCGAFHAGDIILSINDINTSLLTVSKANSMLQSFKKESGQLIFVTDNRRSRMHLLSDRKTPKEHPLVSRSSSEEKDQLVPASSNLFNSPTSLYKAYIKAESFPSPESDQHVCDFQIKTISMLRDVIQNISSLQKFIPFLDYDAGQRVKSHLDPPKDDKSESLVKIDSNILSQIEAMCTQAEYSAREITMHLIKNERNFSLHHNDSWKLSNVSGNINNGSSLTRRNLLQELTENLTEIYTKRMISKHFLDTFIENMSELDFDCYECHQLCSSCTLITQKVLLLLSLNDKSEDVRYIIHALMKSIGEVNMPCEDCKIPWRSVSDVGNSPSTIKNYHPASLSSLQVIDCGVKGLSSLRNSQKGNKANIATERKHLCERRNAKVGLKVAEKVAFFTHTQTQTGLNDSNSYSESETLKEYEFQIEEGNPNTPITSACNNSDASQVTDYYSESGSGNKINNYEDIKENKHHQQSGRSSNAGNYSSHFQEKVHKDKDLTKTSKLNWKSAEAISGIRAKFNEYPLLSQSKSLLPPKHSSVPSGFDRRFLSPVDTFKNYRPNCGQPSPVSNVTNDPVSDATTKRSHSPTINSTATHFSSEAHVKQVTIKTQPSTVEVKLKDEGKGFGLKLGFLNLPPEDTPLVPIVLDVKSQGSAHKSGVLLKGDRVLTINGKTTSGLDINGLENLLEEAFASEEVILTVEFDVAISKMRFGTFDISFDKTAKTGLQFRDYKKAAPLVVKGVVKGSAAHRSGQLFPGDEILFTNCIRQEAFDSFKCSYQRTETVIMTVRREPNDEGLVNTSEIPEQQNTELCADLESNNDSPEPLIFSRKSFNINRTSIHSVKGRNAMVLDQQLTLYRDPNLNDFGFLVGQNQTTGTVYVTGIRPGGPADRSKVIKKKDRILEVNGVQVGNNECSVLSILLQAGNHMDFTTRRILSYRG